MDEAILGVYLAGSTGRRIRRALRGCWVRRTLVQELLIASRQPAVSGLNQTRPRCVARVTGPESCAPKGRLLPACDLEGNSASADGNLECQRA